MPFDARFLARARGKQNDWNGPCLRIRPQFVEQAEAVEIRHHHVGQHQIRERSRTAARAACPSGTACTS